MIVLCNRLNTMVKSSSASKDKMGQSVVGGVVEKSSGVVEKSGSILKKSACVAEANGLKMKTGDGSGISAESSKKSQQEAVGVNETQPAMPKCQVKIIYSSR